MPNYHAILDFETMGQKASSCAVINCAYYVFDYDRFTSDNPYTFRELTFDIRRDKFEIKHQLKLGYKIEKSAIDFWQELPKEVRKQVEPSSEDIRLVTFLENLIDYLSDTKIKYWWTRSNTFDPIILFRIAESHDRAEELGNILKFWTVRDTRTFIDAKSDFMLKKNGFVPIEDEKKWASMFKEHDSIHDVAADILRMQTLTRLGQGLEAVG